MRSVLITGGAGFVGRNVVRHLLRHWPGVNILIVDNLSEDPDGMTKLGKLADDVRFHQADIRDWLRSKGGERFDLVVHLAAVVGGRQKIEGQPLAVATDLAIDADVIAAGEAGLADDLMFFSSSAAYPTICQIRECDMVLAEELINFESGRIGTPDMTYGWAKLTGEYLCSFLQRARATIFRPFSGYGNDQLPTYPFPAIMRRVAGGEDPVVVWGTGEQSRDWIYIEDAIRMAFELWLDHPGGTYNIGTGIRTTFAEFAELAGDVCGREVTVKPDITKPEGVYQRVADMRRVHKLGVQATCGLKDGMALWRDSHAAEAADGI